MIEEIKNAARKAGEIMLDREGLTIETKGTKENLATNADRKVEIFLKRELTELLPESSFLGEEGGRSGNGSGEWIVDPIDGTANYARDLRVSTISIALRENDDTRYGVVYQPYTKEMFWAVKDGGSFMNDEELSVSDRPIGNSMFCTSWSAYNKSRAGTCFRISERVFPVCEDIRRFGTAAYELSLLAQGKIDIYYEPGLQPWDFAAGALILREAGGICGAVLGQESYDLEGPFIAANSRSSFEYLKKIIKEEMLKAGEL
ncbi:MAG TPA: inositol monophosphatase family protein [Candidatus Methanomethylophilaceae archaeon]|nr:inositol monophosphatase family protein [Candidatus Methanomethylophilaceae archaeon]